MGYAEARLGLKAYRASRTGALMGEIGASWFTSFWSSVKEMLSDFASDKENAEISGTYGTAKSQDRIPQHAKLDYVCGLRREIRKQYVSEVDGIYTDVTPFRHGIMSVQGGDMFDSAMEQVLARKGG